MTRKISAIGALALLVAAIAVTVWIRFSGRNHGPANAAEILPADTMFLFEARDVELFGKRLNQTAIAQFFREPDIARILTPLRTQTDASSAFKAVSAFGAECKIGYAFFAHVSAGQGTAMVGGFESSVGSSAFLGRLKQLRETLGATFDFGEEPARRHNGYAVLRGRLGRQSVEIVLVQNHCYFSTDPAVLDNLLDRLDSLKEAAIEPNSLASAENLSTAMSSLPSEWDTRILIQPRQWVESGDAIVTRWLPVFLQAPENLPKTVGLTSKIDGKLFRDVLYVSGDLGKNWPVLAPGNATFRRTALDIRISVDAVIAAGELPAFQLAKVPVLDEVSNRLRDSRLTRAEWISAFGTELRVVVLWPKDSGMPVFELTSQVRNAEKAREVFGRLRDKITEGNDVRTERIYNQDAILIPSGESLLYTPVMMLEQDRLRVVSNQGDLGIVQRERAPASKSTKDSNAAPSDRSAEPQQNEEFVSIHVDSALLAGRTYQLLRPVLALTSQMASSQGRLFDWTQLPNVEVLTRNLQPMDVTVSRSGNGVLMESSGSVTLPQVLAGCRVIQNRMNR
ncbi:MAG TPA: hypothetical protein VIT91_21280 [Chthoniobacterales bacterium]